MAHPLISVSELTYAVLDKELTLSEEESSKHEVLLKAYLDDFWQKGQESLLPPSSGSNSSTIDNLFAKRFVYRNVITECVGRVSGAFFGKAPNWRLNFTEAGDSAPDSLPDEILSLDETLGSVWSNENIADTLARAFETRLAFGRGGLRIYIPARYKAGGEDGLTVMFKTPEDALRAMRVEFVPPTRSKLLDEDGELLSLIKYEDRVDWTTDRSENVIEFSFVDDSGLTWIGTVRELSSAGSLADTDLSSGFDLKGATTFNEFKGKPYITHALYKNNQLLNLALTCAGFSIVDNGFGEMILTNVALETETVAGPDGSTMEVPKRIRRGGGAIQNFVGIETSDDSGSISRATPGVTFRQPTAMDAFKGGVDIAYAACLQEAGQLHALISGDATASGESRIQALTDFTTKIARYKAEIDEMGSWLLSTMVRWSLELSGAESPDLQVTFDSRMSVGPLSESERSAVMSMHEKGVISRATERILLGIDDPALEADLVKTEDAVPMSELDPEALSKKLDIALKMIGLGLHPDLVYVYLGLSPEEIELHRALTSMDQGVIDADQAAAEAGPEETPVGAPDEEDVQAATAEEEPDLQ